MSDDRIVIVVGRFDLDLGCYSIVEWNGTVHPPRCSALMRRRWDCSVCVQWFGAIVMEEVQMAIIGR